MIPLFILILLSFLIVLESFIGYLSLGTAPYEFFLQFHFLLFLPLWYLGQRYIDREESPHEVTRYDLFSAGIV